MTSDQPNPLVDFIGKQIEYFANESRRLRDKGVLVEYKKLVDRLLSIQKKLGTVEHEVALAELSKEYTSARSEALAAWKGIWSTFRAQRGGAKSTASQMKILGNDIAAHIKAIEASLADADQEDAVLVDSTRKALDAMKQAAARRFETTLWKGPWLLLLVNLQIYTVFVRYFGARLAFLTVRHSFIVVVLVLIFGMAYSKFTSGVNKVVASLAPASPWLLVAVMFGAYVFKKYYIDPRLKRLQVRIEFRWLSRVALHLHMVRMFALLSRAQSRPTPEGGG